MKDLFSIQSAEYAKYRPTYPNELFNYLRQISSEKDFAWDCGTGNGQAALELAKVFKNVIATDLSQNQIANAQKAQNIEYRIGSAEDSGLATHSINLITVAQAIHWFKHEAFFAVVKRILRPGGVLAFWCYQLAEVDKIIDKSVFTLYEGVLGPYWEKERKHVDDGYKNVVVPFEEIITPSFCIRTSWSLEQYIGYLSTWSALQACIQKNNSNPLKDFYPELKESWGKELKAVSWKISLRAFQL